MPRYASRLLAAALAGALIVPSAAAPAGASNAPTRQPVRTAETGAPSVRDGGQQATIADELIVVFKAGASSAERGAAHRATGARALKHARVSGRDAELVRVPAGRSAAQVRRAYEARADVASVQPNFIYRPAAVSPNDPRFYAQWPLVNPGSVPNETIADADIDADEAWQITTGSDSVVVAVTDTGVDYTHPDLASNIWRNTDEVAGNGLDDDGNGYVDDVRGWDFTAGDADPSDTFGHGTHVAGIIGAQGNNAAGISGVAWNVSIMPLKVLGDDGNGDTFTAIEAIEYAVANGADVINASWGTEVGTGQLDSSDYLLRDAIAASGVLFVAAAGNARDSNDAGMRFYPASFDCENLIAVAASDALDHIDSYYSNYGATSVDLAAPGTAVLSSVPWDRVVSDDLRSFDNWTMTSVGTQWSNYWSDATLLEYGDDEYATMTYTAPVDLSDAGAYYLSFFAYVNSEQGYDVLRAQVSTDGSNWDTAWSASGSAVSHSTDEWIDLSTYEGEPNVWFRFVFQTDGSGGPAAGQPLVYIDDFSVVRADPGATQADAYWKMSGTSMAAPHVAGTAALALAVNPSMNAVTLKKLLMDNVDVKATMTGMTVTGGRLNARKVVAAAPSAPAVAGVNRLSGTNRYATAVAIAKRAHPGWVGVTDVIIASGEDRAAADPLAAAGLVWAYDGAPLLLVDSRSIPAAVGAAVSDISEKSLGVIRLHVVGGQSAVPDARINELRQMFAIGGVTATYDRVGGADRYDTARKIAQTMVSQRGAEMSGDVLLANGANPASFYDALAFSPIAANAGAPILLTAQAALPPATSDMITTLAPDRVVIGGGANAVSADVAAAVVAPGRSVVRWSGASRYETAARIATNAVNEGTLEPTYVAVAAALPDALSSASVTGVTGGPLLLTGTTSVASATSAWLGARSGSVSQVWILGGSSSVSPGQDATIRNLLN